MSGSLIISFITGSIYFILIYIYYRSWENHPDYTAGNEEPLFLSIIIPFYNEESHILNIIKDVINLDYPEDKYEVILVNDYSTDHSFAIAFEDAKGNDSILILNNKYKRGKKYALRTGIESARGEYVLITDADCRIPKSWLKLFGDFILRNPDAVLISSGVFMSGQKSFLSGFQSLEFSSLVATGAASFIQGSPVMCNAANLAFRKNLFLKAFDNIHPDINTGDDMFLMIYTKRHFSGKSLFLKNADAYVETKPAGSWSDFLNQRLRWSSKSSLYNDAKIIQVSLAVLITNFLLLIFLVLSFVNSQFLVAFSILFILKLIPDYLFLRSFLRDTGQGNLLKFFLPSQLLNIFIIPFAGFAGIVLPAARTPG
jgi:cellulose synthase/poly-beta-1,6-N-acetylglucosamine synthase-like glycosyltransferase